MKYLIKQNNSDYFTGTFEIGGTIIMTSFSTRKEDAKLFDSFETATKEMNRINIKNAIIEEIGE